MESQVFQTLHITFYVTIFSPSCLYHRTTRFSQVTKITVMDKPGEGGWSVCHGVLAAEVSCFHPLPLHPSPTSNLVCINFFPKRLIRLRGIILPNEMAKGEWWLARALAAIGWIWRSGGFIDENACVITAWVLGDPFSLHRGLDIWKLYM